MKVKVQKNLEKTVQNVGSLNLAMISLPLSRKIIIIVNFKQIALGPYSRITV